MNFEFRNGDRVRLIAGYPVREDYWDEMGRSFVYVFRRDYETWSRADTLIPICDELDDDLDTDKISAFIEEM